MKRSQAKDVVRLARILTDAYLTCYVRDNPLHTAPEWERVTGLARVGFRQVAAELLARGVRLPEEK